MGAVPVIVNLACFPISYVSSPRQKSPLSSLPFVKCLAKGGGTIADSFTLSSDHMTKRFSHACYDWVPVEHCFSHPSPRRIQMDYTQLIAANLVKQRSATEDEFYASSTLPVWLVTAIAHSREVISAGQRTARSCASMIAKILHRRANQTGL